MNKAGELIRKLRKEKGWTQSHLAELADINLRTVQRAEKTGVLAAETAMAIAGTFGIKVEELLGDDAASVVSDKESTPFLVRLESGKAICDIIGKSIAYRLQHDDLNDEKEAEMVGDFLQSTHDYGEIWSDLQPKEITEATLHFTSMIKELEAAGFWVFGLRSQEAMPPFPEKIDIANIHVLRSSNPSILTLDASA